MRHILYFLFIWFLVNTLLGGLAYGVVFLTQHLSVAEVLNLLDKKIAYIFACQVLSLIATLITVYVFLRDEAKSTIIDLGLKFYSVKNLLQGFAFGTIPILLVAFTLYFRKEIEYQSHPFNPAHIILYIVILIIGAANEEILARGYILNHLLKTRSNLKSLLYSAILFALFHISNDNLTLIPFINILLSGIFLGVFYIYFRNLWFSIAAHFAWNYFQGPILGSPVSGLKTDSIFKQIPAGSEILSGGNFGFEASLICTIVLIISIAVLYLFCLKHKNSFHSNAI
ncbi:CPBP family intramembrane metalloprotease domain-containing protein [Pedobacter yonginense]|uniref:CPBP family intramembrane metalloprotease domain-containing protein n=1 Tax=Pedobacter yonginense TaxID=651869 RepID=A0A317EQZ8_9SPHI|nr:type II CAAX endopeptidase family protein [Pedobacter yonginense]PWS27548.1 CPBP family intramembrane metalloprotease domain-containing protein [Pedobacter yonginense]